MPSDHPGRTVLSRRAVLGAAAATLAGLSGCTRADPVAPAPRSAVGDLISSSPFYIATRAGARDWPEMSAYAVDQAALLPKLQAIELAVCRSADGVLVCSYEPTTTRLTGQPYTIVNETWETLSSVRLTAAETTNPAQPSQPLARLDEILARHLDRFVFVVEPMLKEATGNLMALLLSVNRPDRFVWKQPINASRFAEARSHGFGTWGYVLDDPAHLGANLQRYAASPDITMIGASMRRTGAILTDVAAAARANDKPAIAYTVSGGADLRRALSLGYDGIASTEITKILELPTTER